MKLLILILAILPSCVMAGGNRNTTIINETYNTYNVEGVALAIAKSQHHFDWSTPRLQGSIGMGSFDNEALSFGLAQKYKEVLINGSIGTEDGKTGFGLGVGWRF